jgi:hypothetical protein
MVNEILQEVWDIKDQIARECDYDVDKLVERIHMAENRHANRVVTKEMLDQDKQEELSDITQ